MLITEIG